MLKKLREFFSLENKPEVTDWGLEPMSDVIKIVEETPLEELDALKESGQFYSPRTGEASLSSSVPKSTATKAINYALVFTTDFPVEFAEGIFEYWVDAFDLTDSERGRVESLMKDVLINKFHYYIKFEWRLVFQSELMALANYVQLRRRYTAEMYFQALLEAHFVYFCVLARYEYKDIKVHKVGLVNLVTQELELEK